MTSVGGQQELHHDKKKKTAFLQFALAFSCFSGVFNMIQTYLVIIVMVVCYVHRYLLVSHLCQCIHYVHIVSLLLSKAIMCDLI